MAAAEPRVGVVRLAHAASLPLPSYATAGSAGLDLAAAIERPLTLGPGERALVPTGLVLELPHGWEGQVRPRSGLAVRHGISLINTPGTIDSDYRGEVKLPVINHGAEPFVIERGARLAQLVVAPVARVRLEEVEAVAATERGEGGFGSTGSE